MSASPAPAPYRQIGIILALIALIRVYSGVTDGSAWRARLYDSAVWWIALSLIALVVCSVVAGYARTHLSWPTAVLTSGLVGATITLAASSIPGIIIGTVVGLLVVFDVTRRMLLVLWSVCWKTMLPASVAGSGVGLLGSITFFHVEGLSRGDFFIGAFFSLVVCLVIWLGIRARFGLLRTKGPAVASIFLFLLVALTSIPVGTQLDTLRRCWAVKDRVDCHLGIVSLLAAFGPDSFFRGFLDVETVYFQENSTNEDAAYVRGLPYVKNVVVGDESKLTDAGIRQLNLPHLLYFRCGESLPTDVGLHALRASRNVVFLDLAGSNVTDRGLSFLRQMPMLQRLDLADTRIDGSGLSNLSAGPRLTFLDLANTDVNDDALSFLRALPSLTYLNLRGTRITADGLVHLTACKFLSHIDLSQTQVREAGLKCITSLPLSGLTLEGIPLTASGIETIARISSLRDLYIPDAEVDDATVPSLLNLRNLSRLDVAANDLSPAGYNSVSNVEYVRLIYDVRKLALDDIIKRYRQIISSTAFRNSDNPSRRTHLVIQHLVVDEKSLSVLDNLPASYNLEFEHLYLEGSASPLPSYTGLARIRDLLTERKKTREKHRASSTPSK